MPGYFHSCLPALCCIQHELVWLELNNLIWGAVEWFSRPLRGPYGFLFLSRRWNGGLLPDVRSGGTFVAEWRSDTRYMPCNAQYFRARAFFL